MALIKGKKSEDILQYLWGMGPWLAVTILLIAAVLLGIRVARKKKQLKEEKLAVYQKNRPPVNVVVQEIIPNEVVDRINLPATIAPWEDLTLLAEVSGTIIAIEVKEGDSVAKGDILARIDPHDYENRLNQIRASHKLAQSDFTRISRLAETDAVSQAQFDAIQARLTETASALDAAELDLRRCTITAPINGFINRRFAKPGLLVNRSDPLFQILDTRLVKVEVGIPESDVQALSELEEAEITVEALNGLRVKGKKVFLSRQPESFARIFNLKLSVENPDNLLRPGMFARVDLVKARHPDSLQIPLYAVITNADEHSVYVVNNEKAHYRKVKLGVLEGWQVQILEGLKPLDRVIVVGQRSVEEGQEVKVIRTIRNPHELQQ